MVHFSPLCKVTLRNFLENLACDVTDFDAKRRHVIGRSCECHPWTPESPVTAPHDWQKSPAADRIGYFARVPTLSSEKPQVNGKIDKVKSKTETTIDMMTMLGVATQ
jgi:hypothetical protein